MRSLQVIDSSSEEFYLRQALRLTPFSRPAFPSFLIGLPSAPAIRFSIRTLWN